MQTRRVSRRDLEFLRSTFRSRKWGWPATLSCNRKQEVWPCTGYGYTLAEEREHLEGFRAILDDVVDDVLNEEPRGGRFHLSDDGAFLASDKKQVTKFLLIIDDR